MGKNFPHTPGGSAQRWGIVGEASAEKQESQPVKAGFRSLVDYIGKSSNFFEDLAALDAYPQSVENNIDTLTDKK